MQQGAEADVRPFPEVVGRYELLLPIGTGGMATVYLARSRGAAGFQREVALKLMHSHLRTEENWTHELIEEAQLASRIRHPNVVQVLDLGDDPFGVYLVMDYVEGDTLSGVVRRSTERIPLPIAMRILGDALAGLHAAHELADEGRPLELVHRDFSPSNILVGVDGATRLADFGIAKAANRQASTREGFIKGKLAYMSPEQARGHAIDRKSDVWAAGVVAWELATGSRLFGSKSETETLLEIVSKEPRRARSMRPDVPAALDDAIAAALRSDPLRRTPTAQDLRRHLLDAVGGHVADAAEVANYVTMTSRKMLDDRRERVREILDARAHGKSATIARLDYRPLSDPEEHSALSDTATTAVSKPDRPVKDGRSARVRPILGLAAALLVVVVILVALRSKTAPEPPMASSPPPPTSSPTGEGLPAPLDSATAAQPSARVEAIVTGSASRPVRGTVQNAGTKPRAPAPTKSASTKPRLAKDPLENP